MSKKILFTLLAIILEISSATIAFVKKKAELEKQEEFDTSNDFYPSETWEFGANSFERCKPSGNDLTW